MDIDSILLQDLNIEKLKTPESLQSPAFDRPPNPILFESLVDPYSAKTLCPHGYHYVYKQMPPEMALTALQAYWWTEVLPHITPTLTESEENKYFIIWTLKVLPQKFSEWHLENWKDVLKNHLFTKTWASVGEWKKV